MLMYRYTNEDLEETLDIVKSSILGEIARDGIMTADEADRWCQCHTVLVRKHPAFERLKNKLKKTDGARHYFIIVKAKSLDLLPESEETDGEQNDD